MPTLWVAMTALEDLWVEPTQSERKEALGKKSSLAIPEGPVSCQVGGC